MAHDKKEENKFSHDSEVPYLKNIKILIRKWLQLKLVHLECYFEKDFYAKYWNNYMT